MFYKAEVDAGIELLDRKEPGWALNVNLDQLGMAWATRCILCQVFGTYEAGIIRLGLVKGEAKKLGFSVSLPGFLLGFITYPVLTTAWKMEIETRQRAPSCSVTKKRD